MTAPDRAAKAPANQQFAAVKMSVFRQELERLVNAQGMEHGSGTPDYVLAEYLVNCLAAYDTAVQARERWHGRVT